MIRQRTIRRQIDCTGIGLHTGKRVNLSLKPAAAGHGVVFRRLDLGGAEIPATRENLSSIDYATTLSKGDASVSTTEHLLSAVYALGIDNLVVELDGPELPIMDGSAAPFIYLLHEAGGKRQSKQRRYLLAEDIATYDDMDARNAAWQKFRTHPKWDVLKNLERYKDTVSNITQMFLKPKPYSQI